MEPITLAPVTDILLDGDFWNWQLWIVPLIFGVGGILIGFILEATFVKGFCKLADKTSWHCDDQIASLLRGIVFWVFSLTGLYLATYSVPVISQTTMESIRKIIFLVGMVIAIGMIAQVFTSLMRFYMSRSEGLQAMPNTSIFENIIRFTVYIVGLLVVLQTIGISVMPIITALGVGGLAISLALQDTLSNIFSGIHMILARQIKVEDYVKLDSGEEGFVQDIGWRNTTIRMMANNMVIIPNNKMASTIITNYSQPIGEQSTLITVGVSYDSDLEKVEKVTIDTARTILQELEGGVNEFEPFIRYHTFGDSSINFTVILRIHTYPDQYLVKHEFVKRLHQAFADNGIEIPFPQRVLHMAPDSIVSLQHKNNGKHNSEQRSEDSTVDDVTSAS